MTNAGEMTLLTRGRTAEIYNWEPGTVLKLYFDWLPQEWIDREARVGAMLADLYVPSPRVLGRVSVSGRQGLVLERIEGPSMLALMSAQPWLMGRLAGKFAELHHLINTQSGAGLPQVRAGLRQAIIQVDVLGPPIKEFVLEVLDTLPDGEALCHFDFHPDQVIMTTAGPKVLDWMTAFQGARLADVARTTVMSTISGIPEYLIPLKRALIFAARNSFHRRYLREYLRLDKGASLEVLHQWMIPVAAGRLRENLPGDTRTIIRFLEGEFIMHGGSKHPRQR